MSSTLVVPGLQTDKSVRPAHTARPPGPNRSGSPNGCVAPRRQPVSPIRGPGHVIQSDVDQETPAGSVFPSTLDGPWAFSGQDRALKIRWPRTQTNGPCRRCFTAHGHGQNLRFEACALRSVRAEAAAHKPGLVPLSQKAESDSLIAPLSRLPITPSNSPDVFPQSCGRSPRSTARRIPDSQTQRDVHGDPVSGGTLLPESPCNSPTRFFSTGLCGWSLDQTTPSQAPRRSKADRPAPPDPRRFRASPPARRGTTGAVGAVERERRGSTSGKLVPQWAQALCSENRRGGRPRPFRSAPTKPARDSLSAVSMESARRSRFATDTVRRSTTTSMECFCNGPTESFGPARKAAR